MLLMTSDTATAESVYKKLTSVQGGVNFTDGVTVDDLDIINGIAVLRVVGVTTPYCYGDGGGYYTGLNWLRAKLEYAAKAHDIREIVIDFDSGGGAAGGIDETAAYIRRISEIKKVTAFVSGMCGSAAYWLASACSEIKATRTAELGSIGVVFSVWKTGDFLSTITSKQSPNKYPNTETDEGRAIYQTRADDLAEVFISAVAEYRKMTPEKVISAGEGGKMLIAAKAVTNGLADGITTLNELLNIKNTEDNSIMDIKELREKHPTVYAAAAADGVQREAKRQQGIRALAMDGYDDLITAALADPQQTPESVSIAIIERQKKQGPEAMAALLNHSVKPVPPMHEQESGGSAEAEAAAEAEAVKLLTGGKR